MRIILVLTAVLFLLSHALWTDAAIQTNGSLSSYQIYTNGVGNRSAVFGLNPTGAVIVTPFAPDVVRVRFHWTGVTNFFQREEVAIAKPFTNWPAFSCTFTNLSSTNFMIHTSELDVEIVKTPVLQVHFRDKNGAYLLEDRCLLYDPSYHATNDNVGYAQVYWPSGSKSVSNAPSGFKLKAVKAMPSNGAYFGGGALALNMNRRGRTMQYWNQDTFAWEESRNPMYAAFPFIYGVRPPTNNGIAVSYGLFFNNPARPVFKLGSDSATNYSFEAADDQMDYFFFGGGADHSMAKVLNRYNEVTGRPCMLPKWAFGYHQSRHSYDTQQKVQDIAANLRSNNIPCDAIYLDIDSQQRSGSGANQPFQLTFNSTFTNIPGMVSFCTNLGMRLVPLVEPLLAIEDPLYDVADTNLYFLKEKDLSTYIGDNFLGNISWLDFSIAATRNWWTAKLTNYFAAYGFEAVWNDLNEPNENDMPLDLLYFLDGRYGGGLVTNDTRKWHQNNKNTFNVLECAVSYNSLKAHYPDKRPFVLSRAGWPGIQRYAVNWSGDNVSSFNHLRHNIRLGASVMISGQPYFGHDVGGFDQSSTNELVVRWTQAGCLNPFFRNHNINYTTAQEPWVFGAPYTGWNRHWIGFRYEIMPYLYSLAAHCVTSGIPFNLPPLFEFTSDTNTWSKSEYEYLVGTHLLAAPVYANGARERSTYLPSGADWYDWTHGNLYPGGEYTTLPASLGQLPLFVREGAIIPMGPLMDYTGEFVPDYLDVHVWPGGTNSFELYEDDGKTTNYQAGVYARTVLSQQSAGDGVTMTAGSRAGSYDPGSRSWYFVLHSSPRIQSAKQDALSLTRYGNRDALTNVTRGWSYSYVDRTLIVKVPDSGASTDIAVLYDNVDSDSDSMPDWWEQAHGLDPDSSSDASGDPDGDGRTNAAEFVRSSDPNRGDVYASGYTNMALAGTLTLWNEGSRNMHLVTNHTWAIVLETDGIADTEFKFVANDSWSAGNWGDSDQSDSSTPLVQTADVSGANISVTGLTDNVYTFTFNETSLVYSVSESTFVDSDGDGMTDRQEWNYGLNPYSIADAKHDEDGDGLINGLEFPNNGDPLIADTDADGASDYEESVAGTDLANALSFFYVELTGWSAAGSTYDLTWNAVSGRFYDVLFNTNALGTQTWTYADGLTNMSGTGTVSAVHTNTGDPSPTFYQMKVSKP
ncbi:MAG: DUF5110 domain-containing protein [Verrucomicrobia bacterium]|nr:DUF5110 domain-containing protein [Verrucomicrobiota bacterium]